MLLSTLPSVCFWCCMELYWSLTQLHTMHHNQEDCNLEVRWPDVGSSCSQPLNPEQHYLLQALVIGLCVESEVMWEDKWRHNNIITSDHPKRYDVNWVFVLIYMNMNLSLDWHPNIVKSLYWNFWCEYQAVQHAISKISGGVNYVIALHCPDSAQLILVGCTVDKTWNK